MKFTDHFMKQVSAFGVDKDERILVAVSGGMDSMCILSLCISAGMNVEVAHVNYGLRGSESDADETLVKEFCIENNLKFHGFCWSPNGDEKGSTQMQCRDFRYSIFEQLMKENNLNFTLLAHHADDSVETFLLDIINGTGLIGTAGIPPKRGKYLRPLLQVPRAEIEQYVNENSIPYRDDKSNFSSNYDRNFIRNQVLSKLEERFPFAKAGLGRTIRNLNSAKELLDSVSEKLKTEHLIINKNGSMIIDLSTLDHQAGVQHLLYSWLSEFGFNGSQVTDLMAGQNVSGRQFLSETHRIVLDRNRIMISEIKELKEEVFFQFNIESPPDILKIVTYPKPDNWKPETSKNVAEFDLDLFNRENLTIRSWKNGDRFKPLGMHGWKKLSDFFIDEKLSIIEKEEVLLLLNDEDVAWVIGHRMDDRFKVNKRTQNVLRIVRSST